MHSHSSMHVSNCRQLPCTNVPYIAPHGHICVKQLFWASGLHQCSADKTLQSTLGGNLNDTHTHMHTHTQQVHSPMLPPMQQYNHMHTHTHMHTHNNSTTTQQLKVWALLAVLCYISTGAAQLVMSLDYITALSTLQPTDLAHRAGEGVGT